MTDPADDPRARLSALNDRLGRLLTNAERYVEQWGTDQDALRQALRDALREATETAASNLDMRLAARVADIETELDRIEQRIRRSSKMVQQSALDATSAVQRHVARTLKSVEQSSRLASRHGAAEGPPTEEGRQGDQPTMWGRSHHRAVLERLHGFLGMQSTLVLASVAALLIVAGLGAWAVIRWRSPDPDQVAAWPAQCPGGLNEPVLCALQRAFRRHCDPKTSSAMLADGESLARAAQESCPQPWREWIAEASTGGLVDIPRPAAAATEDLAPAPAPLQAPVAEGEAGPPQALCRFDADSPGHALQLCINRICNANLAIDGAPGRGTADAVRGCTTPQDDALLRAIRGLQVQRGNQVELDVSLCRGAQDGGLYEITPEWVASCRP